MSVDKSFSIGDEKFIITEFENPDAISMQLFNNNYDKFIQAFRRVDRKIKNTSDDASNAKTTADAVNEKLTTDEDVMSRNTNRIASLETANSVARSAMTVRCNTDVNSNNSGVKIPCGTTSVRFGNKLSASNGGVKIGDGVNSVFVSGKFSIEQGICPGDRLWIGLYIGELSENRWCDSETITAPITSASLEKTVKTLNILKSATPITTKEINIPNSATPLNVRKTQDNVYVATKSKGDVTKDIKPVLETTIRMKEQKVVTNVEITTQSVVTDVNLKTATSAVTIVLPPRLVSVSPGDVIYAYVRNLSANRGKVIATANNYFDVIAI